MGKKNKVKEDRVVRYTTFDRGKTEEIDVIFMNIFNNALMGITLAYLVASYYWMVRVGGYFMSTKETPLLTMCFALSMYYTIRKSEK